MDGIRSGCCMVWKPAKNGAPAIVTVISVDLERNRAEVHVVRLSTKTCATHWVDLGQLSEAPRDALPCGCVPTVHHGGEGSDAA